MDLCIFCSFLPPNLVLLGMEMKRAGFHLLFPPWDDGWCYPTFIVFHLVDAWRYSVFVKLSERECFRRGPFADLKGSLQLLVSSLLRERDKMLSGAILCGGVWNGFLLRQAKKDNVPCQFCGKVDGDGHLFWECTFQPLPSSHPCYIHFHCMLGSSHSFLMSLDRSKWPRCAWS